MNIPIYKQVEYENDEFTKKIKKCDNCEERETCSEYYMGWICTDETKIEE